jgi:hypothetical protein
VEVALVHESNVLWNLLPAFSDSGPKRASANRQGAHEQASAAKLPPCGANRTPRAQAVWASTLICRACVCVTFGSVIMRMPLS